MKPLHLNLAAKPYRDYRPYVTVMVLGWLVVAGMALMNLDTWLSYKHDTRTTSAEIDQLNRQITSEQQRTEAVNQTLLTVNVKQLTSQTKYVNARLAERAFSWSELLDRLERVLPDDVKLESIAPAFSPDGSVHLGLQCVGKSTDSMVRTIDRMNRDKSFANAFPGSEEHRDNMYRFGLRADYRPSVTRVVQ